MANDTLDADIQKADQLRLSGQYEKAIAILRDVIAQSPFLAPAKLLLGRSYFESGRHGQALDTLEEFVDFVPEHPLANKILARLYFSQKKLDQAKQCIAVVLEQAPNDRVCLKLSKEIEDLDLDGGELEDTVKTDRPTMTATMAELYYHQGHFEEARKIYQALLEQQPDHPGYQEKLRMVEHSMREDSVRVVSPPAQVDNEPTEKLPLSLTEDLHDPTTGQRKKALQTLLERVQARRKKAHV
jgi:tetratricopeptide (TPR) repeat protein